MMKNKTGILIQSDGRTKYVRNVQGDSLILFSSQLHAMTEMLC